ncbi:MAG: CoA transferase [Chloroflexi bacterium]|nr:CoA transferase [Chloroflexota bacterium]MDA1145769.1 CoA transferase [Chloroflexota bacterium]
MTTIDPIEAAITGVGRPLEGVRVLSMEQAAALPFATRHLADLGAEVIRVEAPGRAPVVAGVDLFRNKRRVALDLSQSAGPEAFRRIAATCDVVAHNYTPRVMRKFGIDYPGIKAVRDDVVYVSLTGFGTTGPWGERPLFGPGAESISGQNNLIGEADAWPGRPGTIVYADNICGLHLLTAILAALERRGRTGLGQHIDISLYETAISQIGATVAERAFGGTEPRRAGNLDTRFALHEVFAAAGADRHVAVSAAADQLAAVGRALAIEGDPTSVAIAAAIGARNAEDVAVALQSEGVAASVVADSSDQVSDAQLWARSYFGVLASTDADGVPLAGPVWGGGPPALHAPEEIGASTRAVLLEAGYDTSAVDALFATGAAVDSASAPAGGTRAVPDSAVRIERGELSRVVPIEDVRDRWQAARDGASS